jgi:hypothetical protein
MIPAAIGSFTSQHLRASDANLNEIDTALTINGTPQVGSPTINKGTCVKAVGPPVVIGFCSTTLDSSGSCTCN